MMLTDKDLLDAGVHVVHHFGGGVYAKETHIPAGVTLTQHVHPFDHLSILASGRVWLLAGDVVTTHDGPCGLTIAAGIAHAVTAATDAVWYCVHAAGETEVDHIDAAILAAA
jgi:DNA/RNA-binding domain of Phe-tRNA-synthetase-like protein